VSVGVLTLSFFAYLAAVYLARASADEALREDFRRRALVTGVVAVVVAGLVRWMAAFEAPSMHQGLSASGWAMALTIAAIVATAAAFVALWRRWWSMARAAAAAQVSLVIWGWALAQYPYVVPRSLTIRDAAAPASTLAAVAVVLAIGGAILLPSLFYLLRTFAETPRAARRGKGGVEVR
jgi:cytochrome d ubiquinol oxidase subunit II